MAESPGGNGALERGMIYAAECWRLPSPAGWPTAPGAVSR